MANKITLFMIVCIMTACSSNKKDEFDPTNPGGKDSTGKSVPAETGAIPAANKHHAKLTKNIDPRTYGGEKSADQLIMDDMYAHIKDNPAYGPIDVLGIWVGPFGKNAINVSLTKIEGNVVEGYSVCAGNFRKIKGFYETKNDIVYHFQMNESGTDPYDGVFDFSINLQDMKLTGNWKPFKEKGNTAKEYTLIKKKFVYDPHVGEFPDASLRLLDYTDVENLDEEQLAKYRNEIYARHGYSFKNKKWRYYFEKKDWYMPMGLDIRDKLTDIEVQNIELIYEYESYYEEEYDYYGR